MIENSTDIKPKENISIWPATWILSNPLIISHQPTVCQMKLKYMTSSFYVDTKT